MRRARRSGCCADSRTAAGRPGRGGETGDGLGRPRPRPAGPSAALRQIPPRLLVTGSFYFQGIARVVRRRPALVHANDYNTMWIGVAAKLLVGSRVIYDCHELWADRNGRPEWRPWLIACEALFVRVADVTITASPGYAQAIASRYRVAPPRVVRNIPRVPLHAPGRNGNRNPPVAVYLGGVMPGRGLEQAIEALRLAPEMPPPGDRSGAGVRTARRLSRSPGPPASRTGPRFVTPYRCPRRWRRSPNARWD